MAEDELHRIRTEARTTYDAVAADYVSHLADELKGKPFDRKMLDWLAERVGSQGTICDLGCGPGQIAGYLFEHGADVCGIDLSPGMVEQAKLLNPRIPFSTGDMLNLREVEDASLAGIAAFYAIVNIPAEQLPAALAEMLRVLKPGGEMLLSFHLGDETIHRDDWWDHQISIDFHFFPIAQIKALLTGAGFTLTEVMERDPYPDVEYPSQRGYIFARKPAPATA
jgi:ubiquinone/menaquinone biosynthesis C-methylase UbiE